MATFGIPLGDPFVILPDDPADSADQVVETTVAFEAGQYPATEYRTRLNTLAAQHPTCLPVWAALGELAFAHDVIAAYAYFRTGYHRGLDRARASGWRGTQQLRWEHPSNRGFLRCLYGLMRAAEAIGETAEADRTRQFLLELDPANHFGVEGT